MYDLIQCCSFVLVWRALLVLEYLSCYEKNGTISTVAKLFQIVYLNTYSWAQRKILHILKVNLRLINHARLWLLTLQVLVCLQDSCCGDKAWMTLLPSITLGSVFSRTNNSLFSLLRTWSNHRSRCHIHRDSNKLWTWAFMFENNYEHIIMKIWNYENNPQNTKYSKYCGMAVHMISCSGLRKPTYFALAMISDLA